MWSVVMTVAAPAADDDDNDAGGGAQNRRLPATHVSSTRASRSDRGRSDAAVATLRSTTTKSA